jgi:hypothetical protein
MIVCESGGHANGLTYFIFRFLRRPPQERISTAARAQLGGFFTPTSHVLPDDGQEFDIPHQFKDKP